MSNERQWTGDYTGSAFTCKLTLITANSHANSHLALIVGPALTFISQQSWANSLNTSYTADTTCTDSKGVLLGIVQVTSQPSTEPGILCTEKGTMVPTIIDWIDIGMLTVSLASWLFWKAWVQTSHWELFIHTIKQWMNMPPAFAIVDWTSVQYATTRPRSSE